MSGQHDECLEDVGIDAEDLVVPLTELELGEVFCCVIHGNILLCCPRE